MIREIIKKAWNVVDPVYVYRCSGSLRDPWNHAEVVYGKTPAEAKKKCTAFGIYSNIKARRNSLHDIVVFEGGALKRWQIKKTLLLREKLNRFNALPENETFFIQKDGNYVGNGAMFWALNGNGYTSDPDKMQEYTKAEVIKRFKLDSQDHTIWIASHIKTCIRQYIESQHMDREFKI